MYQALNRARRPRRARRVLPRRSFLLREETPGASATTPLNRNSRHSRACVSTLHVRRHVHVDAGLRVGCLQTQERTRLRPTTTHNLNHVCLRPRKRRAPTTTWPITPVDTLAFARRVHITDRRVAHLGELFGRGQPPVSRRNFALGIRRKDRSARYRVAPIKLNAQSGLSSLSGEILEINKYLETH